MRVWLAKLFVALAAAVTGCASGGGAGESDKQYLQELQFNDQVIDCEYSFYRVGEGIAPGTVTVLQIPMDERPVGVVRWRDQKHELQIDRARWDELQITRRGIYRVKMHDDTIDLEVTFKNAGGCENIEGECMDGLVDGRITFRAPGTEEITMKVAGSAGC